MNYRKKIKILLCSPYGTLVGGISSWTGHILNYQKNAKTNIELKHYYSDGKGAYSNTLFLIRLYIGFVSYLPFLFGLRKELRYNQYDVVHFASSASISLMRDILSLKIAKRGGVKSVIHFHFGRIPELYKKRNWEQKLLHYVIKLADKVIVIDQRSYETLTKRGYKNIELLPNPLTDKVTEIIESNYQIRKDDRKIVFAGHVLRTKGVFELIEACKTINNIRLKIVGYVTEDIKNELLSLAEVEKSGWLEFSGELSFEDTIKEMLSAGVFVLPTYTEGFPNVIIESMACACPVVTTNVGAIPEMLDIENGCNYGLCVEPKDVEGLREAIQKMLTDRKFALNCGRNAQKRVNDFYSMKKVWDHLEAIWLTC